MPIKLPKGFARRKSSSNVLETIENPPAEGSFRVLDRNDLEARSTDPADRLKRKSFAGVVRPTTSPFNRRRSSFDRELNNKCERLTIKSSIPTTDRSESSRKTNDSSSGGASSEARFSYASTAPSSVENHSQDSIERPADTSRYYRSNHSAESQMHAAPPPPQPPKHTHNPKSSEASFSIKGRTFSFSPNASNNNTPRMNGSDPDPSQSSRQRAMTESSYASTATPRLDLDDSVGLGLEDDAFGSGFSDIFSSQARVMTYDDALPPPPPIARTGSDSLLISQSPKPLTRKPSFEPGPERIDVGQGRALRETVDSPRSWPKHSSVDKLMSSPPSGAQADDTVQATISEGSPDHSPNTEVNDNVFLDSLRASQALALEYAAPAPPEASASQTLVDRTKQRSPMPTKSPNKSRNQSRDTSPYPPRRATTPQDLFGSEDDDKSIPLQQSTPRAAVADNIFSDTSKPVHIPRQRTPVPDLKGKNKVMTPAEFEFYRKQQDTAEHDDDRSQASESSDNYEDDDDEHERNKQVVRQRRRQEAHLAVYRQQMRKVTGEQPSDLPGDASRPRMGRATQSTPSFMSSFSTSTPNLVLERASPTSPKLDNDRAGSDDDEDVPLGVLQAHGFPHKNRPPTRLSVASTGNIPRSGSASAYPAPPNATRNDPNAGGGGAAGGLPPFARNLPQDPYVGASLINSTNRESLPYNSTSSQPQHQGPLPPGGLVGVIAGEERAKALRRGSPNQQGNFAQMGNSMGLPLQYQPPTMQQQQAHMMPPQMNPQHNATNEMMKEFMQMQMQWMQSMMQMQNMQQNPQMMPDMMQMQQQMQQNHLGSQSFLGPPGGLQNNRPMSVVSHASNQLGFNQLPQQQQQQQQRPFAGMARHGFGATTQSVGPGVVPQPPIHSSSQSIYGMPAGYTPSIAPSERSNVGQPSRYRPVTSHGMHGSQPGVEINNEPRTHTMTGAFPTGLAQQGGMQGGRLTPGPGGSYQQPQQSTIRAVSKPANNKTAHAVSDDEEDEEGWATMRRKRAERKARQKAGGITSDDGMSSAASHGDAGMEALYYDGGSFSPN